jgi:hypothetical protein
MPGPAKRPSQSSLRRLRRRSVAIFGRRRSVPLVCYVDDLIEGLLRLVEIAGGDRRPNQFGNPTEYEARPTRVTQSLLGAD